METPKWPNLRELVQYSTATGTDVERHSRIDDWFQNLSQNDQDLLVEILEPYFYGDKLLEDMPNVSDVLRYTDPDNHSQATIGGRKVKKWLDELTNEELEQVLEHLDKYHNSHSAKERTSLYYSLSEYIFSELGLVISSERRLGKLASRSLENFDRLGRIENDITLDEKVIIRGDRSENLAAETSVVQGKVTRFESPKKDYSSPPIIIIDNSRAAPVLPIMQGAFTARSGREHRYYDGTYLVEKEAIVASLEAKCELANKVHYPMDKELEKTIRKRHIMKIFNTCIDILYETPNSFVLESDQIADLFERHADTIETILKEQLSEIFSKQAKDRNGYSKRETEIFAKYIFALDIIDYFSTSQLYEAA